MGRIRHKLHSQRGASFLFALLAFLVAAMVSVTIVTAAVTSVKRIHNDRKTQQAHLTLTSAAQLVREGMEDTKYITKVVETYSGDGDETVSTDSKTYATGMFAPEMEAAVEYVNSYASDSNSSFELKTDKTGAQSGDTTFELEPVKVSFVMKAEEGEKYKVIFTFELEDSGETLFLTMNGAEGKPDVKTSQTEDGSKTTTTTTTITWGSPIINGLGG